MSLASSCGYPSGYFDHFSAPADEDLEVYRNDVRDVLRGINGSDEGGSTSNAEATTPPLPIAQKILHMVLQSILKSIIEARAAHQLPEETAIHAFSALAKPLNHQARSWDPLGGQNLEIAMKCLLCTVEALLYALEHDVDARSVLPVARTTSIAVASLSPMLSSIGAALGDSNDVKMGQIRAAIQLAIRLSITLIERFEELPDKFGHGQYDARGAMRGPGGEDHVACVALMRLCSDAKQTSTMIAEEFAPFLSRMCDLYGRLKALEIERGGHFLHIRGTTPKSRRILLSVVCRIESIMQLGAGAVLQEIFRSSVASMACHSGQKLDAGVLLSLCEASYDLSAFPPDVVTTFFASEGQSEVVSRKLLVDALCEGFLHPEALAILEDGVMQVCFVPVLSL